MSIGSKITEALAGFESISLEEVQKASLMRRKDNKYVLSVAHLPILLEMAAQHYRILEIEELRTHNYQTTYYDTPEMNMYHLHHRGIVNRHKIRFRKYGTSNIMFFEVKKKDSKGVTVKNRMRTGNGDASILSKEEEFLSVYTPYDNKNVIPVLENSFNRITLVSSDQSERITLDYHLGFSSQISEETLEIPGISIAEIKFVNHLAGSPFHAALRSQKVVPRRFSKYAIGMAMLNPGLKQNLFKAKVRYIHKINSNYLQSIKN
jgi:hypothetical protein